MAFFNSVLKIYNSDGILQNETEFNLKGVSLSRTYLVPGKEYFVAHLSFERGPDGKERLRNLKYKKEYEGRVCFADISESSDHSMETLLEWAIKAGAIAFVAGKPFANSKIHDSVHKIPLFLFEQTTEDKTLNNYSFYGDHRRVCLKEPTWINHCGIDAALFCPVSKNSLEFVLKELELQGVQNVSDMAKLLLSERLQEREEGEQKRRDQENQETKGKILFPQNFSLKDIGVGGLGSEFERVFRRLFVSRMFSPSKLAMLGISHVRGMLLVGPPGCGKTLLARRLSQLLKTTKLQVISGPEVFSKWMGESEGNVRKLFQNAEKEWAEKGERSDLHVILIDEIDAMVGKRSSESSCSRSYNSVVNQLLAKMDGVDQLNNILLIGMTNRVDDIDPALLRPGRFELQLNIDLPTEEGRLEILQIHTRKMQEGGLFDGETAQSILCDLARETEGFSGAELEAIIKGACTYAMDRCMDCSDWSTSPDESKLELCPNDFVQAKELLYAAKLERDLVHSIE